MDKENIYELTLDDLPDSQREIAEVIGIDNLLNSPWIHITIKIWKTFPMLSDIE